MNKPSSEMQQRLGSKACELGVDRDILACMIRTLRQQPGGVQFPDLTGEMDTQLYCDILKQAFEKRRTRAEADLFSGEDDMRQRARQDLSVLNREELTSDAFYRAVLPYIVRVVGHQPILRLHAEEASDIVLMLADFKRKYRCTTVSEVIARRCLPELDAMESLSSAGRG